MNTRIPSREALNQAIESNELSEQERQLLARINRQAKQEPPDTARPGEPHNLIGALLW